MTHTRKETAKDNFKKIWSLLGSSGVVKYKSAVLSNFAGKNWNFL